MNADERPSKRDAFSAFLREGWVSLHLDARRLGVAVPPAFATEPHLVLQYGRNMPIPIPDLEVTDEGVSATLSFSREPHKTHVPWSSVYVVACTDGRGILYYEDVPQEVSLMVPPGAGTLEDAARTVDKRLGGADEPSPAAPSAEAARDVRWLRSVPAESEEANTLDEAAAGAENPKRRRKPQLRLVK